MTYQQISLLGMMLLLKWEMRDLCESGGALSLAMRWLGQTLKEAPYEWSTRKIVDPDNPDVAK